MTIKIIRNDEYYNQFTEEVRDVLRKAKGYERAAKFYKKLYDKTKGKKRLKFINDFAKEANNICVKKGLNMLTKGIIDCKFEIAYLDKIINNID